MSYISSLDSYPTEKMDDYIIMKKIKQVILEMKDLPEQPDYYFNIIKEYIKSKEGINCYFENYLGEYYNNSLIFISEGRGSNFNLYLSSADCLVRSVVARTPTERVTPLQLNLTHSLYH